MRAFQTLDTDGDGGLAMKDHWRDIDDRGGWWDDDWPRPGGIPPRAPSGGSGKIERGALRTERGPPYRTALNDTGAPALPGTTRYRVPAEGP